MATRRARGTAGMARSFADYLQVSLNPVGLCTIAITAWIAACDGAIDDDEQESLDRIAKRHIPPIDMSKIRHWALASDIEMLQLSCEVLRKLRGPGRRASMKLAVGMALADGYLTTSEIHILHLLADLLSILPSQLNDLFGEITGHPFPAPTDPSTIEWWRQRESQATGEGHDDRASGHESASASRMTRVKALAILGLEDGATTKVIQDTFRRLAKVHHPDRFASLGPEAVEAATTTFTRIRAAYDTLIQT